MKNKDFLIVGLGIAGISVAEELNRRNYSFLVYDDDRTHSTSVAGGVVNPVVLKRYKFAFQALEYYRSARKFYNRLRERVEKPFYLETEILKIFSSIEDQNDWGVASASPEMDYFLKKIENKSINGLQLEYGYGRMQNIPQIDSKVLLSEYHDILKEAGDLVENSFDTQKLKSKKKYWYYQGVKFNHIVFCEGVAALKNPLWESLPIVPNKGEYLIFKSTDLKLDCVLKDRFFLIPLGKDLYKFGATYSRDLSSYRSDEEQETQLREQLEKRLEVPYEILRYEVGMRPTVKDRRPLVGQHPEYPNCHILNGTGSRGFLMAPKLAQELIDSVEGEGGLQKEINVNRFF